MTAKKEPERVHPVVLTTDLTAISRSPKRCRTRVVIHLDWDWKQDWLIFGACQICRVESTSTHRLEGRMAEGVTDF